jgi:hypothetical protein
MSRRKQYRLVPLFTLFGNSLPKAAHRESRSMCPVLRVSTSDCSLEEHLQEFPVLDTAKDEHLS